METETEKGGVKNSKMSRSSSLENTWKIRFRFDGRTKTAFVIAKDHKRAERLAQSYPNVIGVSKATRDYIRIETKNFKTFTDKIMENIAQPKLSPLAMDEFLWLRRNKRIDNRDKDRLDS